MATILSWLLPVSVFAVSSLWIVACAAQVQAEDIRRGTPKEARRGVSIFPGIPLFVFLFWALLALVNRWFQPWGTIIIGGFHITFAVALLVTTVRDIQFCRSHEAQNQ